MGIQTVAMIGVGAIGSFMAPRLQDTLGENFRVIVGGGRKVRMDRDGIRVNGEIVKFNTVAPEEETGPADLVIIAVKSTALDEALEDIRNQVGPDTNILCVLNGVDTEERVAARYGWKRVLFSFMRVSVVMENYACSYDPDKGQIIFGEKDKTVTPRAEAISELFRRAGIKHTVSEDIIHDMWFKFMANIGENMTCALLGVPFGAYHVSDNANAVRRLAMTEVITIANRLGIGLGQRELDRQEKIIEGIPFPNKPSTLQDLEAGRKTEIELFSGTLNRLGRELDIPTPVNTLLYHSIRVLEEKNAGKFTP